MVRRISIIFLIILAIVSVISVNFPLVSYAASAITVTDNVSFTGNTPKKDTAYITLPSNTSNIIGIGIGNSPSVKGNVATFVISVANVPSSTNGTFSVITSEGGTGSIAIQNGSGSTTISSNTANIKTTGGSYSPGHTYPPGCYYDTTNNSSPPKKQSCSGKDTSGNTINTQKNCYIETNYYSFKSGWMIANCNGLTVSKNTPSYSSLSKLPTCIALSAASTCSGGSSSSSNSSTTPTCQAGGALDWVYCAIYNSLTSITNTIFNDFLVPELKTSPICISPTGSGCQSNDPTYKIWSSFRVYGDIILVVCLLVAVISEAMGGGLMDAYSVRKILPRILAAAILINLSIYIIAAAVDVTNIIGGSLGTVITAPIGNAGAFTIKPNGAVGLGSLLGVGLLGMLSISHIGGLFSSSGGSMLIDVVLVPALLIFASILITIIIRKVAIIALIIIAPLAFAFYCLPSTEKYFKKWWSLMLEMLMMYPIIVLVFAVSSVFSVLLGTNPAIPSFINSILALVATVIPLILIPFSFKLAGDTIGRLHGAIDGVRSRASSMHEPRRKRAKENYRRQVVGNRANMYGRLERSGLGGRIGNVPIVGGRFRKRAARATQAAGLAAGELAQTPGAKATEHDDLANWASTRTSHNDAVTFLRNKLAHDHEGDSSWTPDRINREANGAADRAAAANGFGRIQALHAARQLAVTGTGYQNLDELSDTIAYVSGGNESTKASLSGDINAITKQVNRHDLAPGAANLKNLVDLQERKQRNLAVGDELENGLAQGVEQAWNSGSIYQHANDKPQNLKNAIEHYTPLLAAYDNPDEQDKAIVFFRELESVKQNATGEVRDLAANALEGNKTQLGLAITASQAIPQNIIPGLQNVQKIETRFDINNQRARTYNPNENIVRAAAGGGTGQAAGGGTTGT